MKKHIRVHFLICFIIVLITGCMGKSEPPTEIGHYPLDSLDGIITRSNIEVDKSVSSDSNGSLRIRTGEPATIRMIETGDVDVENARLIYSAKLRTENVEGKVYLEMLCHFAGKGEFFSRSQASPMTGSNEWASRQTPFLLKKGENPDNIKLNLVIDGSGTVWVDDIRLIKTPLK